MSAHLLGAALTPPQRKPLRWPWRPELLSDTAQSDIRHALGIVPFFEGAGPPRDLLRGLDGWGDGSLEGSAAWTVNERGAAVAVNGQSNYVGFSVNFSGRTEYSYLLVTRITTVASGRLFMAGQTLSNGLGYDLGGPYIVGDNGATFFPRNGANNGTSSRKFSAGEIVAFICRYNSGETNGAQLWADGEIITQATISGTPSATYNFQIGQQWNSTDSVDHEPMLFVPFDAALDADTCERLTRDPYSILRPDASRILSSFYAAASGSDRNITGTLTAAAFAMSSAGTVLVSGTSTMQSAASTADGAAAVQVRATGALESGASTTSGAMTVLVAATGALTSAAASIASAATVLVSATGDLISGPASISGRNFVAATVQRVRGFLRNIGRMLN